MPSTGRESFVRVAAGCIENSSGEILICQRPEHKIYPGEWEFPGGKLEPGETAEGALFRELAEELGITVTASHRLIRLRHVYPELSVDLDVWKVTAFTGELRSREHPQLAWVKPDELPNWKLLAADSPIVNALRLPTHYIVTPPDLVLERAMEVAVRCPPGLFRFRLPHLQDRDYDAAVRQLSPALRKAGHVPVIDRGPEFVDSCKAGGFHASAAAMRRFERRPVPADVWFGVSCHNAEELECAIGIGADYVVLGPVQLTASHPEGAPLGWDVFRGLAEGAGVPVYAIGGVGPVDLDRARLSGAQGVAGISAYWGRGSESDGGVSGSSEIA